MGKLLLAALFGGFVAAALTFFLMNSLDLGDRRAETDARMARAEASAEKAEGTADVTSRRLELLQRRLESATREHVEAVARIEQTLAERPAAAAEAGTEPTGPTAADGTPYVSRAELEAAIAKARAGGGLGVAAAKPVQAKSLEEIAREMNLSAFEESEVRRVLREGETEALSCFFGDRPIPEIVNEVRAAKEDPERMQTLVGEAAGRAFQNMGKILTLEGRTRKKVEGVLGKERAKDLMSRPHTPVLGDEFKDLFKDLNFN